MRLLLTGANGQLGRHLQPRLAELGELITTGLGAASRPCDLTDPEALDRLLREVRPDILVNPAAWTAVDAAEDEADAARRLNEWLPAQLAHWCVRNDALLIHYSTDYVFSGRPRSAWTEEDAPAPASVYGRTKLAGERAIRESGARAIILRTAWLYSCLPGNFLSAIIGRAARGEALRVVSDQVGSPTWAGSLAEMTKAVLQSGTMTTGSRILHAVNRGQMSWHEFAQLAVTMAVERGLIERPVEIEPISSAQWPQRAERPRWSVLEPGALERLVDHPVPSVEQALTQCMNEWKARTC